MPRSVSASMIQVSASATVGDLPTDSASSTYTLGFTVPTRGVVKRVTLLLSDGASFGDQTNQDSAYLHTTADGGAGKDTLAASDAAGVLAAFPIALKFAEDLGFDIEFASSTYVACYTLGQASITQLLNVAGTDALSDASSDIFYYFSGTTLGPVAGTGTLYWTLCGAGANFNWTTVSSFKVILDIEPCT